MTASIEPVSEGERERPLRIAVVGVSTSPTCGVRDHAVLLAEALGRQGVSCSLHWLWRSEVSLRAARSEVLAWTRRLSAELDGNPPDAVLLHYSVFAYSDRGLPLFVRPVLSALHRSRIPLVTLLHEFAYPWGRRGWRGKAWALTQRALLIDVVRASTAVVVTTDFRAEWIASRHWLPKRPVVVAPVFSTLPAPSAGRAPERRSPVVGLFGYSAEGAAVAITLDAVRLLEDRGAPVQLILLGAPGRSSSAGEAWLEAARSRRLTDALSFSGVLAAQELSDALAACEVLLFAETAGPTSRKTTLAASLASARPVVAIDGPHAWSELVHSGAARVVAPTPHAMAHAIAALLADEDLRAALGRRGRAFAEREMGVARSAGVVSALLGDILTQPGASPRSACQVERAVR